MSSYFNFTLDILQRLSVNVRLADQHCGCGLSLFLWMPDSETTESTIDIITIWRAHTTYARRCNICSRPRRLFDVTSRTDANDEHIG